MYTIRQVRLIFNLQKKKNAYINRDICIIVFLPTYLVYLNTTNGVQCFKLHRYDTFLTLVYIVYFYDILNYYYLYYSNKQRPPPFNMIKFDYNNIT